MEKQSGMKRGQTIAFRIPQDTPDHILKELSKLKEKEKRNFSAKIAGYVIQGVNQSLVKDKETITIPLPRKLTKVQHDWLKHEHSEAMLGSIVYELIQDPLRATSLFAALSKQPVSMDETLFLQEDELPQTSEEADGKPVRSGGEPPESDDLDAFDWRTAAAEPAPPETGAPEKEEDAEDLLGDFLASMNK